MLANVGRKRSRMPSSRSDLDTCTIHPIHILTPLFSLRSLRARSRVVLSSMNFRRRRTLLQVKSKLHVCISLHGVYCCPDHHCRLHAVHSSRLTVSFTLPGSVAYPNLVLRLVPLVAYRGPQREPPPFASHLSRPHSLHPTPAIVHVHVHAHVSIYSFLDFLATLDTQAYCVASYRLGTAPQHTYVMPVVTVPRRMITVCVSCFVLYTVIAPRGLSTSIWNAIQLHWQPSRRGQAEALASPRGSRRLCGLCNRAGRPCWGGGVVWVRARAAKDRSRTLWAYRSQSVSVS